MLELIGVTGVGHTSGTEVCSVEKSGGNTGLLGGGESGGSSDEGGNEGNFALRKVPIVQKDCNLDEITSIDIMPLRNQTTFRRVLTMDIILKEVGYSLIDSRSLAEL